MTDPATAILLPYACRIDIDYAIALAGVWGRPGRLLVIEHDMAPTSAQVQEVIDCDGEACTIPYRLAGGEPSLWSGWGDQRRGFRLWGEWGDWADGSGLGLVALSARLRSIVAPPRANWDWLAEAVSDAMHAAGFAWHVHAGEVVHHHDRPLTRGCE